MRGPRTPRDVLHEVAGALVAGPDGALRAVHRARLVREALPRLRAFAAGGRNAAVRTSAVHLARAGAAGLGIFLASSTPLLAAASRASAAVPAIETELMRDAEVVLALRRARDEHAPLALRCAVPRAPAAAARALALAASAGFRGPLFLTATLGPERTVRRLRDRARAALDGGAGRIDLSPGLPVADLLAWLRGREEQGAPVTVGVWSVPEEADPLLDDLLRDLGERREDPRGPEVLLLPGAVRRAATRLGARVRRLHEVLGLSLPRPEGAPLRARPPHAIEVRFDRPPLPAELRRLGAAGLADGLRRTAAPLPFAPPRDLAREIDAATGGR